MADSQKPVSQIELELNRCLKNLRIACEQWETGNYETTEVIATILRTLLHDTPSSHSLFGQLGLLQFPFYAYPNFSKKADGSPTQVRKLAWQELWGEWTPQGGNLAFERWVPMYSRGEHPKFRPEDIVLGQPLAFEDWWKELVLETDGVSLTRKQLITDYANKFAGAHSSPTVNSRAKAIMEGEIAYDSYFASMVADGLPAKKSSLMHEACIRQIAFEVQLSINQSRPALIKDVSIVPAFPNGWRPPTKVALDPKYIATTLDELFREGKGASLFADELLAEEYWNGVIQRLKAAGL